MQYDVKQQTSSFWLNDWKNILMQDKVKGGVTTMPPVSMWAPERMLDYTGGSRGVWIIGA